ncbi:GNAT family N-acetyltransferase [Holospora curviuscula]|uniref:Aminoglycoside N(6')-acetyltransferase type 1 n=1 Tax=Holospora curviuscula TaxID=1082868 RepID=A0A2S5R8A6_9PROT|nr:GNAT family N-acetyltransferase [Holospora curviuscula]PPE03412.1 Aminoglycoside N(6')-acetyltransferase type 1 [Holospora curviuscula]
MTITFKPLHESHFPLLLKWLESPHVKKWWDQDVTYMLELVKEKFGKHIRSLTLSKNSNHKTYAYIICVNKEMIGYIQAYNARDFAQENGLNLSAISGSVCGIDLFIGEQPFLHKGWGTRILNEFEEQILTPHFDWCLIHPSKDNLTAIKAFTKAGFKIFEQFQTESTAWMLKDLSSRNDPLPTIQKLIKERYEDAQAVFWAGSVSVNHGTSASDLYLVIVFEEVAHAYREAFIYDGWPIDAFIHDLDTLKYFCRRLEASDGKPALINMILHGQEILAQNSVSMEAKVIAAEALANGPNPWNPAQIDKERFLITDILDDIKSPKNKEEQIISVVHLFEPLLQFYFRAARKWTASGKSLIRLFKQENPELAEEWTTAFESLVKTGDSKAVETVVTKILEPYGGYLWDGFRSDAPEEWKEFDEGKILDELKSREPIFHHPEKFGKTKQDIENQMCDEFWEVGASGNVYTKKDVIETLLERYNDPDYQDIWEAKDFELTTIAPDNYLLTYTLIQDKTRVTRRSTLWSKKNGDWKILYHQGTLIEGGGI